jgi:hypothetical protein
MHGQVFFLCNACQWQAVKDIHNQIKEITVILVEHLFSKPIHLGASSALVITSKQDHFLRVANFHRHYKYCALDSVKAPIYVIPKKQIIGVFRVTAFFNNMQKVVVLTMNISNNDQRFLDLC